jgi:hypothetical protein
VFSTLNGDTPETFELSPFDAVDLVQSRIAAGTVDLVVCENFTPRVGIRTWEPDALKTIGALEFVCHAANRPFELQMPADAKRFVTNEKLAKLGWRAPSKGGHADDALRHLVLALVKHDYLNTEVLL